MGVAGVGPGMGPGAGAGMGLGAMAAGSGSSRWKKLVKASNRRLWASWISRSRLWISAESASTAYRPNF